MNTTKAKAEGAAAAAGNLDDLIDRANIVHFAEVLDRALNGDFAARIEAAALTGTTARLATLVNELLRQRGAAASAIDGLVALRAWHP